MRRACGGAVTTSTGEAETGMAVADTNLERAGAGSETWERMAAERASRRVFFAFSILLFLVSAAATIR